VRNNKDVLGQSQDGGRIREALIGKVQNGKTSEWWPFFRSADAYTDWTDEKTLEKLVGDEGKQSAKTLGEWMFTIAKNTEQVIHKIVNDWNKRQSASSSAVPAATISPVR
jgi:hypothetical protein